MPSYDVVVVGGGAAGMTAALYALRNGKTVLVIEKEGFGGQITHSPKVENYPGFLSISGNEFADRLFGQIIDQGAEFEIETVCGIEDKGSCKLVKTAEGSVYEALTVILATGVKHRMLGLEGENELVGEGISFCAVCDGDFYSGKPYVLPAAAIQHCRKRSCCRKSARKSLCCRICRYLPVRPDCRMFSSPASTSEAIPVSASISC